MNPRRPHPSQPRRPETPPHRRPVVPRPSPPSDPVHSSQHHRQPDPGRHVASLVGITVLAVAVLLAFVYLRLHRQGAARTVLPVAVGVCVATPSGELLRAVDCTAGDAYARVTASVREESGTECPADTDSVAAGTGRLLCLVNLRGPHPGAPGTGGGLIRPGDCVDNPGTGRTAERACGDGGWYGKVVARVERVGQCRPPAAEALSMHGVGLPVVCLAPAARVGSCLATAPAGPPNPAACTDPRALGRVLGRAATGASCPVGTTGRLTAPYGLPAVKVICLGPARTR